MNRPPIEPGVCLWQKSRILWWDGEKGAAYSDGVNVELRAAPRVGGIADLLEIDFAPRVGKAEIRRRDGHRRMTADEVLAAEALLDRMSQAAHLAVDL